MNPFRKAIDALTAKKSDPGTPGKKKRITSQIDTSVAEDRVKMEMNNLVTAIENAIYPGRPDRRDLLVIYANSEDDSHVISQIEIAKSKLLSEPFVLTRNGTEDSELIEKFRSPWFEDWLTIIIDAMMWGYTLVEAGPVVDEAFSDFSVFPRRHVEPFKRHILIRPSDIVGIPYGDNPASLYFIEIGHPKDLGRFKIVAREVIWKNFSRSDWSQASEKFGMPFLHFKTATDDKDELDRIEALCRNFASNGYIISSTEDEVTVEMPTNSDFYKIFQENAQFCDQQISKCINGQTGTSDEKSFVGSAEVHERILDDFSERRLRTASNLTNTKLIPFLSYHGWQLEGVKFRFPALDKKAEARLKPGDVDPDPDEDDDNDVSTNPNTQPGAGKKKVQSKMIFPGWVINMPEA